MKQTHLALSLGLGALILATQHAFAQAPNCAPHAVVMTNLAARYGETRQMIGIAANTAVIELWGNLETGTWTLTVTLPDGPTCLAAAGEALEMPAEALPLAGAPA